MPFNVLCGPASSGKTAVMFDEIEQAVRAGRHCWLVVPTSIDARAARIELVRRLGACINCDIGTFHQLHAWLAGPVDARTLSTPVARMQVGRLLRRSSHFTRSLLDFPAYLDRAYRILHEVLEATLVDEMDGGVESGELARVLGALVPPERARWIATAHEYAASLEHLGLIDDIELARRAWRACEHRVDTDVFLYGFDDLSALQQSLLAVIAKRARVVMSVPFVPGRIIFERRQREIDALKSRGARITHADFNHEDDNVLAAVAHHIGEPTAAPIADVGVHVRFIESCGDLGEAEDIIRAVAEHVRDGYQLDEIACITPDPSRLRGLIEACCNRVGMPVEIETPRTLSDVPAGRIVLDLIAAGINQDESALLRLVRSGGVAAERFDEVEHDVRPWLDDPDLARSQRRPRVPTGALSPAIRSLVSGDVARDPADALRAAIGELTLHDAGDIRLIRSVEAMLCDLSDAAGSSAPSWQDIVDAAGGMVLPPADERRPGHLVVAPISRVRTARFKVVIVFGLHASGFVSAAVDDPDAPSLAREALYTALTRPTDRLVIARQACGADGREVAPHSVWYDICCIVPDAPVERRTLSDVLPQRVVFAYEHELWSARSSAHEDALHPWQATLPSSAALLDDTISVTSLESYVQCPARWFIEQRLLRRDHDLSTPRQVIGRIVHDALANLLINPDFLTIDGDGQLRAQAARADVDAQIQKSRERLGRATPVRDIDVLAATLIVARVMDGEAVYGDVVHTEQPFGRNVSALPSIEIDGVRLTGVIDRYDITDAGDVTIVDYKLGWKKEDSGAKLVSLGKLQLLLYWHAIAQHPGVAPVAAIYRPLSGQRPRGLIDKDHGPVVVGQYTTDRLPSESIDEAIEQAIALAKSSVAAIREGVVVPQPRGGACPDWCKLGTICRVGELQ